MHIGGFKRFSLIDYPGKSCAVIFTQGCNFRCPYCHNPELVDRDHDHSLVPEEEVMTFLKGRKGQLDGVVVTGGEPTLQPDLLDFLGNIKDMGFLVKVDTNGSRPEVIERIIDEKLADYIAMDAKGPLDRYEDITNSKVDTGNIRKSLELIKNSGHPHEFRTTVVKSQLSDDDIMAIGRYVDGASSFVLQEFVPSKTLDPNFLKETSYTPKKFSELKDIVKDYVGRCLVR